MFWVALLAGVIAAWQQQTAVDDPGVVIRSTTSIVQVRVVVQDSKGKPVTGLQREDFRARIMSLDTGRWFADRRHITASIGVTTSNPGGDTPSTMLQRADAALYVAKRSGRNCCRSEPVVAPPPDERPREPATVSTLPTKVQVT